MLSLSEDILNIKEKKRSNLFPWRGQFSPQLVEALLTAYSSKDDFVLDLSVQMCSKDLSNIFGRCYPAKSLLKKMFSNLVIFECCNNSR